MAEQQPTGRRSATGTGVPTWTRSSTLPALPKPMETPNAQPSADRPSVAPEPVSGATLLTAPPTPPAPEAPPAPEPVPDLPPLPPLRSKDGRVLLTDTTLTVRGEEFLLMELERAELTPVRWILWYLLGGLGLTAVLIAFLQNWLRTGPAMLGMAVTGLLLAYGHRGTNRMRLHRLGREMVNFALPGETMPWQNLTGEVNRRIFRVHDHAARVAAATLAAADEAARQASLAAQAAAEAAAAGNNNALSSNS